MKNITKKKIVLVTLSFILGFSIPILTNSNKVDIQEESLPKTNALTETLLHSYDFEGDTVGQDPSGLTLSVIEPAGSGTANVDNLADVQQNHVAVHKDGGEQRVELRDNISYYGNTFDAGVFHCKIYHDDSLFGILFQDDIGVLFRLDWYDGIIGRWSPQATYTTYNYNQWYDVVVYFNLTLGWMFEIDGVRFGDGYTYPFEHGGSGGLEWIRWCSAFSGGGNGFFRVDDIEFYYYEQLQLINYIMVPGYEYNWIDASGGTELILSDDGYATVALPFTFQFYNDTFSTIYLGSNGYLSFTDSSPSDYTNDPIPSGDVDNYYLIAPFWDDIYPPDGGHIYVQSFGTYWVAAWVNIYQYGGSVIGSFEVVLYNTGEIMFNYDYLDYTSSGYTCGLNLGVDIDYYNSYQGLTDLTDTFSIKFTYEPPDHDLSVSLDTPMIPKIGNSYLINATVTNTGISDENNVDLFLYLDDVIVDSITISSLPVGASETINYMWTPSEYRSYNFTAYAPPVPGETITENNIATEILYISFGNLILFDEAHNPMRYIGAGYSDFAGMLTAAGHIVNTIDLGTVIDATVLSGCDILVIATSLNAYTVAELDAIETWVGAGGSLLLLTDWGSFGIEMAPLAARFGFDFKNDAIIDSDDDVGGGVQDRIIMMVQTSFLILLRLEFLELKCMREMA